MKQSIDGSFTFSVEQPYITSSRMAGLNFSVIASLRLYATIFRIKMVQLKQMTRRMTVYSCACCVLAWSVLQPTTVNAAKILTSADALQTSRFMVSGMSSHDPISISPNGLRYVIRVATGDVKKNGVWVDILTGAIGPDGKPSKPIRAAHLFSTGRGARTNAGPEGDASGLASPLKWLDDAQIAFLFSDSNEIRQVVVVNLDSHRVDFRTHHPTQIRSFDIAPNGTVVYLAASDASNRKNEVPTDGYVVPDDADAVSLVEGYFMGGNLFTRAWDSLWFSQRPRRAPAQISIGPLAADRGYPNLRFVSIAPNGQLAVIVAPAEKIPLEWDRYAKAPTVYGADLKVKLAPARADPNGLAARDITQLYLVELQSNKARPLWKALGPGGLVRAGWSHDSKHIVIAPTPIPDDDESGDVGETNHAVIFDILTKKYQDLGLDGSTIREINWSGADEILITGENGSRLKLQLGLEGWRHVGNAPSPYSPLKVKQNLNSPPVLVAVEESTGEERLLLDPNPGLIERFTLGISEFLQGTLTSGEHWTGLLTLPSSPAPKRGYPLVIQGQAGKVANNRFTLYGWSSDNGLGPCDIAPYASQILAGRSIAVLQIGVEAMYGTPAEVDTVLRAYSEVALGLVDKGIVDREKVGISGFSRNGYFTYQALSRSTFKFAAGAVIDNYDPSYIQTTLLNIYADAEGAIGAPPFGAGLALWLERSTGFNVERITAPVLLIGQSGGFRESILWQWEILGRLRHLKRPVEMYLMPEIDTHPSHSMQNPAQIIAVQERIVDWFDFWLNGHEADDSSKRHQYMGWRRLKKLKTDVLSDVSGGN